MGAMPSVSIDDLQAAVEWVSAPLADNWAVICRETGTISWIAGDSGLVDEAMEPPEDADDESRYLPVPSARDLDVGNQLVFSFVAAHLPEQYDPIRTRFRRKGAYAAFKRLLLQSDLLESWYDYQNQQTRQAIRDWCESEDLEVAEPGG